ncbi:MAG TPA: hypothetical protein PLO55_12335, partial [Thermotogota bacterium]|nr:hypothetical protein [Thermotogota bacterium]
GVIISGQLIEFDEGAGTTGQTLQNVGIGNNVITINRIAQNNTSTTTWTVTVNRASGSASSEAHLSALDVSGTAISFDPLLLAYDIGNSGNASLEITPTMQHAGAKILSIVHDAGGETVEFENGVYTVTPAVAFVAAETVTITVLAEDNVTTVIYVLTIS